MVKDAEAHSDVDAKKESLIKARNEADQLIYTSEKTLKEHGDKVSDDEKKNIQEKIEALKTALKSDSAETLNQAKEELIQASHKLAEEMYKQAATEQQEGAGQAGPDTGGQEAQAGSDAGQQQPEKEAPKDDGAVDADFEVVDEEKDK